MNIYLENMEKILRYGKPRPSRTGVPTRSLFGIQSRYSLNDGFPAVTTKKLAIRAVIGELIGFVRSFNNAKQFSELGCNVWSANSQADYWTNSPHYAGEGDLGRIYGHQWRSWKGADGSTYDQLQNVINGILRDPYGRRHIVNAWKVDEIEQNRMALPPCHVLFQFYATPFNTNQRRMYAEITGVEPDQAPKGTLDLQMYQRSADFFLGVPFNIASYAMLLHMVAHVTGYEPGDFIHTIGDAHIYENHIDQVREQLSRSTLPLPSLKPFSNSVRKIDDFEPDDFKIVGYTHHSPIAAEMAV